MRSKYEYFENNYPYIDITDLSNSQKHFLDMILDSLESRESLTVVCDKCKKIVTIEDLDVSNNSNEIGEDYYEYSLECSCGNELISDSSWGECYGEDVNELFEECLMELRFK